MKKRSKIFPVLTTLIFVLMLSVGRIAADKGGEIFRDKPAIVMLIGIFGGILALAQEGKLKELAEKYPKIGKRLGLVEEKPEKHFTPDELNSLKRDILKFTKKQYDIRMAQIIGHEAVGGKFRIKPDFIPGTSTVGDTADWEKHATAQFGFITGEKGGGKSYEMIQRVNFFCIKLKEGLKNPEKLKNHRVPLYIELKSLDKVLDYDWLADYIQKTAEISRIKFEKDDLESFLTKQQVFFFFDGIDEIPSPFRKQSVEMIVGISQKTGVTCSCRKEQFDTRIKPGIAPSLRPAEWLMPPLPKEWIFEFINALKGPLYKAFLKNEVLDFLKEHPQLLNQLSRPIILNIFLQVYPLLSPEEKIRLSKANADETLKLLWGYYEDLIARKKLTLGEDVLRIRTYTVYLAAIMENKPFYIESIQPNWLVSFTEDDKIVHSKVVERTFRVLTRIIASMFIGVALGCIISTPVLLLSDSIIGGVIISVISGIYLLPSRSRIAAATSDKIFQAVMIVTLILICGVYHGMSIPHEKALQTWPLLSIAETWPGILLGITLSSIFSYRIVMEKEKGKYILPVETFHFDWPHAFRYGFTWGGIGGLIVGFIAMTVNRAKGNMRFFDEWLVPQIKLIGKVWLHVHGELTERQIDYGVFAYGAFFMFMVASLVITVLAGRYADAPENVVKKQKLDFGILQSFRHALVNAGRVLFICALFYTAFAIKMESFDVLHLITFPVGMFIMAFLWFGGMEGINHYLLRASLYIRGIAPKNYNEWFKANELMGLVVPTGYQMTFYHPTMGEYFHDYPLKEVYDVPRLRMKRRVGDIKYYILMFLAFGVLLIYPFYLRFGQKAYWGKDRSGIAPIYEKAEIFPVRGDSVFQIKKTGYLHLSADGAFNFITVGSFVGWVWPSGTAHGFFGLPMHDTYNVKQYGVKDLRHGALLFSTSSNGKIWSPFKYVTETPDVPVKQGTFVQFLVNDREPENNKGKYNLSIKVDKFPTNEAREKEEEFKKEPNE